MKKWILLNNDEFKKRIKILLNINIEKEENVRITIGNNYHKFGGQNVTVAITFLGNNQEDSVIFNAKSTENEYQIKYLK